MPRFNFTSVVSSTKCALLSASVLFLGLGCSGGGGGGGDGLGFAKDSITVGSGQTAVRLSWQPPTTYLSGDPLTEPIGFVVYYRPLRLASGEEVLPTSIQQFPVGEVEQVSVAGLEEGEHEFSVATAQASGSQSAPSSPVRVVVP